MKFSKKFDLNKMFKNFEKFRSKFRNKSILVKNYSFSQIFEKFRFWSKFSKFSIIIKLRKKISFFWSIFLKISIFVKVSKKKSILVKFSKISILVFSKKCQIWLKFPKISHLAKFIEKNSILIKFGRNLRKIAMFLFKNIRL